MVDWVERKFLIESIEDFFYKREDTIVIFPDIEDLAANAKDPTVKTISREFLIFFRPYIEPAVCRDKEAWDLWQRLLLVLRSGAELRTDYCAKKKHYSPFTGIADIRTACNICGEFRKTTFHKAEFTEKCISSGIISYFEDRIRDLHDHYSDYDDYDFLIFEDNPRYLAARYIAFFPTESSNVN
jgi:hypothetical protein